VTTWTDADYIRTVQGIAQDAIDEYPNAVEDNPDPDNESWDAAQIVEYRQDYVSESVDGSEYVIYYAANEIVLQATQNEPDGAEVRALSADDADWRAMRALAAYMAMEADVHAEIDRIAN
tara:strand:+ start:603 stop:962 length:360 start_codon:yes stop_codon:yes gene_type:complete